MTTENQDNPNDSAKTQPSDGGDEGAKAAEEKGESLVEETEDGGEKAGDEAKDGENQEKDGDKKEPALPDSADKYDLTLPEDVGLKDENGDPFQFSADDPLAKKFRDFAFSRKLPQEAVTELVKMYGEAVKGSLDQSATQNNEREAARKAAELEKLEFTDGEGKKVSGGQRVENLTKAVKAAFGDRASKIFLRGLISSDDVIEAEKFVAGLQERAGKQGSDQSGGKSAIERMYGGKS